METMVKHPLDENVKNKTRLLSTINHCVEYRTVCGIKVVSCELVNKVSAG